MSLRRFGLIIGLVFVAGYFYWQHAKAEREAIDSIGADWGATREAENARPSAPAPAAAKVVGWSSPKGKSILGMGTDASASMTALAIAKQASMLDSVVSHISGDNLLSLYTMGSKVYRHNTGSSDAGRVTVLNNWKEFKPYKQDSLFTNCTAALTAMISDVLPLIQQGYVASIILITDGHHEPPPEQDDEDMKWEIENALNGIPAAYRNRLHIDIVEVGGLPRYSGQVAGLMPSGFANTRLADYWDDVLPVVMELQKRIDGRFGWVNAPVNGYRIGAPSQDDPKVLGPFSFDLSGPEQADFQIDLATNDLVDSSEQLVLEASVDNGDWVKLTRDQITLKNGSAARFRFYENSRNELPSNWFDVWQREYTVKIQPVGNLVPLLSEGEAVKVAVEKPPFIWEAGAWLLLGALACVLLFLVAVYECIRVLRRRQKGRRLVMALPSRPVANIAFGGEAQILQSGAALSLGQIIFTASPDGQEVSIAPLVPVRVEYTDLALMKKVRQALVPSETFTLNPELEARIINLASRDEHSLTPVLNGDITPITNMLLTTGG